MAAESRTAERRMLLAFAHPDDESFGMGGAIAKYVAEGVEVSLICTTNGDAGTIPEAMRDGYESIAALRLAELDCASAKLGFKEVFKLGYKDSGMMGAESTNDPACSWAVWQNQPERLISQIEDIIRQVQPQVVVTFNEYGGYGHPDHIAVQAATLAAFNRVRENAADGAYRPQKLYYTNIPIGLIRFGIWRERLRFRDPRKVGVNKDIDMIAILDHAEPPNVRVNVTDYMDIWQEANACHASQGGGRGFGPSWLRRLIGARQGFRRVHPAPEHNRIDESDLFDGVIVK